MPSKCISSAHAFDPATRQVAPCQAEGATLAKGRRAARATGAAVAAAAALLEATVPGTGARILVLTGGPATVGPGRVVGLDLAEPLRTHKVQHLLTKNLALGSFPMRMS